jgi:hypothetical protein
MTDVPDDEITSAELDTALDDTETLNADHPADGVEVRLYVSVDEATLRKLEQRAAAEGADLSHVAADALRAGARAA